MQWVWVSPSAPDVPSPGQRAGEHLRATHPREPTAFSAPGHAAGTRSINANSTTGLQDPQVLPAAQPRTHTDALSYSSPTAGLRPCPRTTPPRSSLPSPISHLPGRSLMQPPKPPIPTRLFPSTASPTSAFLLVFPSPTTDTERTTCLAGEALPGRRVTGTGIPVRLSSTAPPGHEQLLRALLILRRGKERPHAEAPTARPRSPPDPRPECSRPAGPRPRPAPHLPAPSARPHWSARRARGPRHWMRWLSVRGGMGGATRAEQRAGLAEAKKGAGRGNDGGGAGRAAGSGGAGCAWDGAVAPKGIWDGDCEGRGPSKHSEAAAGPIRAQVYWCFPAAAPPASPQRDPYSSDPASNSGLPRP